MPLLRRSVTAGFGLALFSSLAAACALIANLGDVTLNEGDGGGTTAHDGSHDGAHLPPGAEGGATCATTELDLSTPEMMLLLDLSGSMSATIDAGSRHLVEVTGVSSFIRDPDSQAILAGVAYHPSSPNAGCNVAAHTNAAVPLQPVAGDGGAQIISSVSASNAQSGTSVWYAGIAGAKTPLSAYVDAGKKPTLVFVADLDPLASCPASGIPGIEAAIRDLQNLGAPVRTYVIGLPDGDAGPQIQVFDRLARAGNTEHKTAFTTLTPTSLWFANALDTIRDELRCEVDLPSGDAFDPNLMSLTLGDDAVPLVAGIDSCNGVDGFYSLHAPAGDGGSDAGLNGRARLCPATCTKAKTGTKVASIVCR